MTVAQKTERKKRRIQELCDLIKRVFTDSDEALDLPTIEYRLKALPADEHQAADELDTFEVRDAVSRLERTRQAELTPAGEVRLVK